MYLRDVQCNRFLCMPLLYYNMKEEVCYICGASMKSFDIVDPDTGEKVAEEVACPDEWKESHQRSKV